MRVTREKMAVITTPRSLPTAKAAQKVEVNKAPFTFVHFNSLTQNVERNDEKELSTATYGKKIENRTNTTRIFMFLLIVLGLCCE